MFNHMHNLFPFYYPEESSNSGSMGKEDLIQFFGEDDPPEKEIIPLDDKKETKKETIKSKDETDDKTDDDDNEEDDDEVDDSEDENDDDDELTEIEEELEEPDEEKLGLVTPVRRKEILAKYPKLFKDFPYLETAYYREQKYTELLPTIDDAKEAVEKASTLDKFESELLNGNTKTMLKAIKNGDDNAFKKVVDNYLTTLSEVDEKAYHHVIGNTIKHTIMQMVSEGRRSNNEALQSAAQILNQFVFGSSDFIPPTQLSSVKDNNPNNDKEIELDRRERDFAKQRFDTANGDINSRVNGSYRTTIEANIDPKQTMSDYVRRNASREAFENLDSLIGQDKRFKVLVDKLWENASKTNYSKESTDRIRQAFIAKARTLLPSVIKKARNEALRGMGKRVRDTDESEETIKTSKKSPIEKEKTHSSSVKSKSKIPEGMSTLEFLSQD